MARPIVFLKAKVRGDTRTGDLFDTVVTVGGYTNKHGTYVGPHPSRKKKRAEPSRQQERPGLAEQNKHLPKKPTQNTAFVHLSGDEKETVNRLQHIAEPEVVALASRLYQAGIKNTMAAMVAITAKRVEVPESMSLAQQTAAAWLASNVEMTYRKVVREENGFHYENAPVAEPKNIDGLDAQRAIFSMPGLPDDLWRITNERDRFTRNGVIAGIMGKDVHGSNAFERAAMLARNYLLRKPTIEQAKRLITSQAFTSPKTLGEKGAIMAQMVSMGAASAQEFEHYMTNGMDLVAPLQKEVKDGAPTMEDLVKGDRSIDDLVVMRLAGSTNQAKINAYADTLRDLRTNIGSARYPGRYSKESADAHKKYDAAIADAIEASGFMSATASSAMNRKKVVGIRKGDVFIELGLKSFGQNNSLFTLPGEEGDRFYIPLDKRVDAILRYLRETGYTREALPEEIEAAKPKPKRVVFKKPVYFERPEPSDAVAKKTPIEYYGKADKKQQDLRKKDIAKLMRADVARGIADGRMPKGMKISITSDHNSIDISVTGVPIGMPVFNPDHLVAMANHPYGYHYHGDAVVKEFGELPRNIPRYSGDLERVIKDLEAIHSKYNWDKSDYMSDYHSKNYYGAVGVSYKLDDSSSEKESVTPPGQAKVGDIITVNGTRYLLEGEPPRWHKIFEEEGPQEDGAVDQEQAAEGFAPTHELSDGTLVVAHPEESGVWVDANGDEYEDDYATPIQADNNRDVRARKDTLRDAKSPSGAPEQKASDPAEPGGDERQSNVAGSEGTGALPVIPRVEDFGVPEGATKKERRRLNARALDLLESKESFTPEEKAELARYSGQGGIGDSLNEYYTRPDVAAATWSVLRSLGVERGDLLEPACGAGVFLAAAPSEVRVTGVELDGVSSRIAQALHDRHEVVHNSLERFATSDSRLFDGVIGNAPFGVRGETVKNDKPDLPTAEQYFLDTAIDKTRADGIVALIVPTGIMDGKNARAFRERILRKAELVGAHRLPNTAFSHSHTGVTSDLVIFRRRAPDVAQALGTTVSRDTLKKLGIWDQEFVSGNYFAGRGASNIYGTPEEGWRAKAGLGNDFTVSGDMHGVADAIAGWVPPEPGAEITMQQLLNALGDDEVAQRRAVNAALKPPYEVAEVGDTKVVNGITYVLQGNPPRWHRAEGEEHPALADARELAEQIDLLASGEGNGAAEVSALLDKFIEAHGNPHAIRELKAEASQDPRMWRLLAAVDKHGAYSDLITGRQSEKGDSFDAVATRLAHDKGGFTANDVAGYWTGGDREEALDHLFASPGYAVEADGRTWTTIDDYLSGNLWDRLDAAREALAHEGLTENYRAQYQRQMDALENAIDRKPLEEVEIAINSGWIPVDVLNAWQASVLEAYKAENPTSSWARDLEPTTFEYTGGIYQVSGGLHESELLAKYLNRTGVRKDDMPRIEELNQEFRNWLLTSEHRERVEEHYNRTFRGQVEKVYSQTPLQVPGLNPDIDINPYHWANLRWALDRGKGILAPDVGLGKTFEGLAMARLLKASGQAKKPVIVVPKSVLSNWAAEIELFFPGSKVMMVGETIGENGKPRADTKADRDRKLHEIAQSNSADFILISQSAFDDIDLDPVTKKEYHDNDFWVQRGDKLGNAGDKRTKRIREAYKQEIARREVTQRTDAIYFNDLGIDALIGDEFHAYKNLYAARSRFGETPRFLGGSGLSDRSLDVNYKARWLLNQNDGRNVYGLSATPTKNSPLEIYSMISHVAPELWVQVGIKNAEDFLDRYALFEEGTYLGTNGEIATGLITVGFKNMDELRGLMSRYILRQTAAEVGLKIPKKDEQRHLIDMSAEQDAVYEELRGKVEQGVKDDKGESHIFRIMSDMAKVALDPELYDPERFKGARPPKLEAAAEKIVAGAKDGGQVVFADHNGVHEKLAKLIVKRGVPRERIGIINGQVTKSAASRQNVADAFNRGDLLVVIGNTGVMGEGLNLQKDTTDSHDLDIPWDPATLQQRHGRSVRQKNKNDVVRMHSYLAKGSFDGYRYQTMAAKRDWQDLIWNGGDRIENLAREGAFTREDMLIMLSADPEAARKAIEENKSLQQERIAAAGRAVADGRYVKFQEMMRGYNSLKNKGSAGAAKLKERIDRERASLRANRWFLGKEALDVDKPAVVQPQTGHVWYEGKGIELEGGKGPINLSKPTRWVVLGVDPQKGTVKVRRYGQLGDRTYNWDIDDMARGVKEVEYDQAAELAAISHAQAELANTKAAGATSLKDVVGMDHDKLRELAPKIQDVLKEASLAYKGRWDGPVPMLDKNGNPVAFHSYHARARLHDHDFMLPLPENREKAMQAWIQAEKEKKIGTKYHTSRGRTKSIGTELKYEGFEHGSETGNPWNNIGRELFGGAFVTEAQQKLKEEAKAAIAGAKSWQDAVIAAQWTIHDTWNPRIPHDMRQVLLEKAKELGISDRPISQVLNLSALRGVHPGLFGLQESRVYNDEWHSIERVLGRAS